MSNRHFRSFFGQFGRPAGPTLHPMVQTATKKKSKKGFGKLPLRFYTTDQLCNSFKVKDPGKPSMRPESRSRLEKKK
jgi:hypothetical protein